MIASILFGRNRFGPSTSSGLIFIAGWCLHVGRFGCDFLALGSEFDLGSVRVQQMLLDLTATLLENVETIVATQSWHRRQGHHGAQPKGNDRLDHHHDWFGSTRKALEFDYIFCGFVNQNRIFSLSTQKYRLCFQRTKLNNNAIISTLLQYIITSRLFASKGSGFLLQDPGSFSTRCRKCEKRDSKFHQDFATASNNRERIDLLWSAHNNKAVGSSTVVLKQAYRICYLNPTLTSIYIYIQQDARLRTNVSRTSSWRQKPGSNTLWHRRHCFVYHVCFRETWSLMSLTNLPSFFLP